MSKTYIKYCHAKHSDKLKHSDIQSSETMAALGWEGDKQGAKLCVGAADKQTIKV